MSTLISRVVTVYTVVYAVAKLGLAVFVLAIWFQAPEATLDSFGRAFAFGLGFAAGTCATSGIDDVIRIATRPSAGVR